MFRRTLPKDLGELWRHPQMLNEIEKIYPLFSRGFLLRLFLLCAY